MTDLLAAIFVTYNYEKLIRLQVLIVAEEWKQKAGRFLSVMEGFGYVKTKMVISGLEYFPTDGFALFPYSKQLSQVSWLALIVWPTSDTSLNILTTVDAIGFVFIDCCLFELIHKSNNWYSSI